MYERSSALYVLDIFFLGFQFLFGLMCCFFMKRDEMFFFLYLGLGRNVNGEDDVCIRKPEMREENK